MPELELPCIRVVIPALNEERSIGDALAALAAQEYPRDRYEVIVVVDSKTSDGTVGICETYGVKILVDAEWHTIGGATDLGFRYPGEPEVLASTHADTRPSKDWLRTIGRALAGGSGYDGVGGPLHARVEDGLMPEFAYGFSNVANELMGKLLGRSYFAGPNYAYRREAYLRVGGLNRELLAGDDNDLSIRMGKAGARLLYEPKMRVFTSSRRFDEGYLHTLVTYTKLFIATNLGRGSHRFKHVR